MAITQDGLRIKIRTQIRFRKFVVVDFVVIVVVAVLNKSVLKVIL